MEPKAAFGEMRTITTLLGSVAALVLAAAFGAAVSEDPEVSVLGLRVIAAVFVVLAGSLAATWGVSRWRWLVSAPASDMPGRAYDACGLLFRRRVS